MSTGFIWDRKTGEQIAWIENGTDVFSVATKRKFATVDGSDLYSLSGQLLGVHLENIDDGNADIAGADTDALVRFKKLASEN
jgi:hypothetical protein